MRKKIPIGETPSDGQEIITTRLNFKCTACGTERELAIFDSGHVIDHAASEALTAESVIQQPDGTFKNVYYIEGSDAQALLETQQGRARIGQALGNAHAESFHCAKAKIMSSS